jgi:hypothetical protein
MAHAVCEDIADSVRKMKVVAALSNLRIRHLKSPLRLW